MGKLSIFIIEGSLSIPFLIAVELCKSANSGSYRGVSPFRCFLFGDNRGLRFSVRRLRLAHFFIFHRKIKRKGR